LNRPGGHIYLFGCVNGRLLETIAFIETEINVSTIFILETVE